MKSKERISTRKNKNSRNESTFNHALAYYLSDRDHIRQIAYEFFHEVVLHLEVETSKMETATAFEKTGNAATEAWEYLKTRPVIMATANSNVSGRVR
jgi:hypothetical protein